MKQTYVLCLEGGIRQEYEIEREGRFWSGRVRLPEQTPWAVTECLSRDAAHRETMYFVAKYYGRCVVDREPDEAGDLRAENCDPWSIVDAVAKMKPIGRDGDCPFCGEWIGCPTEEWLVANDYDFKMVEPTTPRQGRHGPKCLWLRARRARNLTVDGL